MAGSFISAYACRYERGPIDPGRSLGQRCNPPGRARRGLSHMNRAMLAAVCVLLTAPCTAESIRVDAAPEHVTNTIRPTEALGAGVDRLPYGAADKLLKEDTIRRVLAAGWQTVTYRQNTELHTEAWHWNPRGSWSDAANRQGYWTSDSEPREPIQVSYGYRLPRRGNTIDQANDDGYSRIDDGDDQTFWKSNPYLDEHFTGEDNSINPQWVMIDLGARKQINAMRILWSEPYATDFSIEYGEFVGQEDLSQRLRPRWKEDPLPSTEFLIYIYFFCRCSN